MNPDYDLIIIGGGINGCGIARDMAGRGLRVLLCERDDLASHTSNWSSKLIHGGLRYLEHFEFRLVREALREREVLLKIAPHITRPLSFVLPHAPGMRPAWMLQLGLWIYDHLGGAMTLPRSQPVRFPNPNCGLSLRPEYQRGFIYSDLQVDDARLTVLNALSAREKGATILTRVACHHARRREGLWQVTLRDHAGSESFVTARGIVNAAGPWVKEVAEEALHLKSKATIRWVKGSHIVVPRLPGANHAYILQNPDRRIIFVIPFADKYSLIGTTDVPVTTLDGAEQISPKELDYLLESANRYMTTPLSYADVVWTYAGVRPLFDDGERNPSQVTRDYTLQVMDEEGGLPLLTVLGGKLTTFRELANQVAEKLKPYFPEMKPAWTHGEPLPGGDTPSVTALFSGLQARYSGLPKDYLYALLRRYGTRVTRILDRAEVIEDLGIVFSPALTQREVDYLMREEWAMTADDVLWRRTKAGLGMTSEQRQAVSTYIFSMTPGRL